MLKNSSALKLVTRTRIKVRFTEVDSLGIAWHGHYVTYFEDGREAFGTEHNLGYLDFYRNGLVTPIVNLNCDFKRSLKYGDTAIIETTYIDSPAAKIQFQYRIFHEESNELVAEGSTVQVFLDAETRELILSTPEYFENWKKSVLLPISN